MRHTGSQLADGCHFFRLQQLAVGLAKLLIECAQFVLGCGVSETDDLLLNTLGAMAGYACLPLARLVSGKHEK